MITKCSLNLKKNCDLHIWWITNTQILQARAPSAYVIIVGTHVDVLRDKATRRNFPPDFEEAMVGMVEKLFLGNKEPDKCGLPNILGTINVSCKTGENIRKLVDMIKTNVFEMRHPSEQTFLLTASVIYIQTHHFQCFICDFFASIMSFSFAWISSWNMLCKILFLPCWFSFFAIYLLFKIFSFHEFQL